MAFADLAALHPALKAKYGAIDLDAMSGGVGASAWTETRRAGCGPCFMIQAGRTFALRGRAKLRTLHWSPPFPNTSLTGSVSCGLARL